MACLGKCPREQVSRDPASPGTIADCELICRAVFPSNRHRDTQLVKVSAITRAHLWAGELSVWRVSTQSGLTPSGLIEVLDPILKRAGETFDEVLAALAVKIKAFTVDDSGARAVSLLDDCTYDREGNKHPAHAHIAICETQKANMTLGDDKFVGIQEGLKLIFEGCSLWRRT